MKNTRPFAIKTRVLSFILTLLLIFYTIPATVFAEVLTVGTDETQVLTDTAENFDPEAAREIYEVEELREENAKHFRLEDGSYLAASYVDPVHFLDEDGKWQDIDNRLFAVNGEFSTSNARVKFAKKITGNENLFTLHDGNAKITMGLLGAKKQTEGKVTTDYLSDDNEETKLGKMTNLEKLTSVIVYENILDGTDLEYIVKSNYIKENIIVKERKESYNYFFNLKLNNLTAELSDDGSVKFIDDVGEVSYIIPAPFVYDSNNTSADANDAHFTLTENKNGSYLLGITVSSEWMNAEERAYPVTIDPTIASDLSTVTDLYIDGDNPSTNYNSSTSLKVGSNKIAYWKISTLPTLPAGYYIAGSTISLKAQLGASTSTLIGVHKASVNVNNTWTWASQNKTNYALEAWPEDYQNSHQSGLYEWNVTEIVRGWYSGKNNYGLGFKIVDGSVAQTVQFYSNEYTSGSYKPQFKVNYCSMLGAEDYWSFNSHSAGIAGEGFVNLANGNLVFCVDGLTTTDSLMPVSTELIYNSALANKPFDSSNTSFAFATSYMPLGFKLNIQETVVLKSIQSSSNSAYSYYFYVDADGTEHQFEYQSGKFVDQSAKGLSLVLSNGVIRITDRDKTVKSFARVGTTDAWYLSQITDKVGNSVVIGVDSSYRPISVSLKPNGQTTVIEMLTLEYISGKLAMIRNRASGDAVIFKYSDTYDGSISSTATKYLRQVAYVNAKNASDTNLNNYYSSGTTTNITVNATASYEYNSSGKLIKAKDNLSGRYLEYRYTLNQLGRIIEYTSDETAGQSIGIIYNYGHTKVRSSGKDDVYDNADDTYTHYNFDMHGRPISSYSTSYNGREIYGGTSVVYEEQENVKNNIKQSMTLGGSKANYILNGGFEDGTSSSVSHWAMEDTSPSSTLVSKTGIGLNMQGNYGMRFTPTGGDSAFIYQYVHLDAGNYTISMQMYSIYENGATMNLRLESLTNSQNTVEKRISLDKDNASDGIAVSMPITVTSSVNGGDNFKVIIEVESSSSGGNGFVDIDCIMLEKGFGINEYNHVQMGDFEYSNITSSGSTSTLPSSKWTASNGTTVSYSLINSYERSARISGSINNASEIKQTVFTQEGDLPQTINTNRSYTVSGYAYAPYAIMNGIALFGLRVDVYYFTGYGATEHLISHFVSFNDITTSSHEWQFISYTFNTAQKPDGTDVGYTCVSKIDVACVFSNQAANSYAYFDNISFVRTSSDYLMDYKYTASGKLAASGPYNGRTFYEYDSKDRLIRTANNSGEIIDFTYVDDNSELVAQERFYTFRTNTGDSMYYPSTNSNPDSIITKTPQTITYYTYNSYGKPLTITQYPYSSDGTTVETSSPLVSTYTYYDNESTDKAIFGALKTENDGVNAEIKHFYNAENGLLKATVNGGYGTTYNYDALYRLSGIMENFLLYDGSYGSFDDCEKVNYNYSANGNLSSIVTTSTIYNFTYDAYGNVDTISTGADLLVNYDYNPRNGKQTKATYANGFVEEFVYNDLDMVSEVWYTNNGSRYLAYRYSYRADGQLHSAENAVSGKISLYEYDLKGRLVGEVEYDKSDYYNKYSVNAEYDVLDRITHKTSSFDYAFTSGGVDNERVTTYYYYTDENTLGSGAISSAAGTTNVSYSYNNFKQLTGVSYDRASFDQSISLDYLIKNGNRSALVSSFTSTAGGATTSYSYTYDNYGNITSITSGGQTVQYKYDGLKRLTREDNPYSGTSTRYYYAENGNILRKDLYSYTTGSLSNSYRTYSYTYGNSDFGDQLTAYDGVTITYDALGNPLSYYNGSSYTFTWTGRQLTTAKKGTGSVISYEYNASGMRTSKTVGGAKTLYFYDGDRLVGEMNSSYITVYLYSPDGGIAGMQVRSLSSSSSGWSTYWYERNLQGDIVAIYNNAGTKLASYTYDAWGNHTPAYHNGGGSITAIVNNPFRYRSYYYDTDLNLYYLGSRYYDPAICRFINMDAIGVINASPMALTDKNLYAYCDNNPVMRVDYGGDFWLTAMLIGAGVSVAAQYLSDVVGNIINGATGADIFAITSSGTDYLAAAVGGAFAAIPGANFASVAFVGAVGNIATGVIKRDIKDIGDLIEYGAIGALANVAGSAVSKGLAKLKVMSIDSMGIGVRKDYINKTLFNNPHTYRNASFNTYNDNDQKIVENSFAMFRYGVYSTFTSTLALTIYGMVVAR